MSEEKGKEPMSVNEVALELTRLVLEKHLPFTPHSEGETGKGVATVPDLMKVFNSMQALVHERKINDPGKG